MLENPNEPEIVSEVVSGFCGLPIMCRLEFVRNLICSRIDIQTGVSGQPMRPGTEEALTMMMANGILEEVMEDLRSIPAVAEWRGPT